MISWQKLQRQLIAQQWWVRTCCYAVVGVTILSLFLSMFGTNSAHIRSTGLIAFKDDNSTTSLLGRHVERLRDVGNKFVSTFWSWGDPYDDELLDDWSEDSDIGAETIWDESAGGNWVPEAADQDATWDNPDGTWPAEQVQWPITEQADQEWTGQDANWDPNAAEWVESAEQWDNQDAVLAGDQANWVEPVQQWEGGNWEADQPESVEPAQDPNWAEERAEWVEPAQQWDDTEATGKGDQAEWEEPAQQWQNEGSWEANQAEAWEPAQDWDSKELSSSGEQAEWTEPAQQWETWEEEPAGLVEPAQEWDESKEWDAQEPKWEENQAEWAEPAQQWDGETAQWEEDQAGVVEGGQDWDDQAVQWEEDPAAWVYPSQQWEDQDQKWAGGESDGLTAGQADDAWSSSDASGNEEATQDTWTDDSAQKELPDSWKEHATAGSQPDNAWDTAESAASSWEAASSGQESWSADAALDAFEEGSNGMASYANEGDRA